MSGGGRLTPPEPGLEVVEEPRSPTLVFDENLSLTSFYPLVGPRHNLQPDVEEVSIPSVPWNYARKTVATLTCFCFPKSYKVKIDGQEEYYVTHFLLH